MTELDDPKHPLYPAFESLDTIPPKAWMVIYQGLTDRWLATSPFYDRDSAIWASSLFDRGVRIVEMTVTAIEDVPMDVRLAKRKEKRKHKDMATKPAQPKVRRVRKVKAPPPEVEPDDGVPEEPPAKKMKVRRVRKATQSALFDEEE